MFKEKIKRLVRRWTLCSDNEHSRVIREGGRLHKVYAFKKKCTDCNKFITNEWEIELLEKPMGFSASFLKRLRPIDHAQIVLCLSATDADDESLSLIYDVISEFNEIGY